MKHFLYSTPTKRNLAKRTLVELRAWCLVLVISHSGTKARLTERILSTWELRQTIKDATPGELVERFTARELKEMCKRARKYAGGKKATCAQQLVNWRESCRAEGRRRIKEATDRNALRRALAHYWGPL